MRWTTGARESLPSFVRPLVTRLACWGTPAVLRSGRSKARVAAAAAHAVGKCDNADAWMKLLKD
eukprot:5116441-Pyramimonas_sp.AAC.1